MAFSRAETSHDQFRRGRALSVVSAAVLWVEGGLVYAVLWGSEPGPVPHLLEGLVLAPVLSLAAVALSLVYVLPSVLLAHWAGRRVTGRTDWWWVPAATTVWLLPALGTPALIQQLSRLKADPYPDPDYWFTAGYWLPWAAALFALTTPAALLAHAWADDDHPARPCGKVLGFGVPLMVLVAGITYALYRLN
jgi:hypothetical protein